MSTRTPHTAPETTSAPTPASTTGPAASEGEAALARVTPDANALRSEQLQPVNLDLAQAYTTVLGALAGILYLRPRLARLPEFELASLDKLHDFALALLYVHASYLHTQVPASSLAPLAQECSARLDVLLRSAAAAVDYGLLPAEELGTYRKANGYRPLALDVIALVRVLTAHAPRLQGRTAFTREDLDAAERCGNKLLEAVAERERLEQSAPALSDLRQRVFTLFASAWDDVRRGVTYLRWKEGDADKLAPSLYAGRNYRSRDASAAPTAASPAAPVVSSLAGDPASLPGLSAVVPASPFED